MNDEVNSMDYLVVTRDRLLKELRENRETHVELYEAAKSGYFVAVSQEIEEKSKDFVFSIEKMRDEFGVFLTQAVDAISNEQDLDSTVEYFSITLSKFGCRFKNQHPKSHVDEYDAAIAKVEMSAYPNIRLSNEEFMRYVMNDWVWKREFKSNFETNFVYASGACNPNTVTGMMHKFKSY